MNSTTPPCTRDPRITISYLPSVRYLVWLGLSLCLAATCHAGSAAGFGLQFDGASGYATVANSPELNVYPLTLMAWFKTGDQGTDRGLINKYVANSLNGYQLYLYQGHIRAWYFRDNSNYIWDGSRGLDGGAVADGAWHHVAFTVDASGGKLYVDGVLRDSRTWTGSPGATSTPQDLQFGRYVDYFAGMLDEVSVWNVALSESAIAATMNQRLAGNESGLLAYWNFDSGFATTAADLASSAAGTNDATLSGGITWYTSDAPIGPLVTTEGISRQSLTGASLNGEVNPLGRDTLAWFEYGTNILYGASTPSVAVGSDTNSSQVIADITGLTQGQVYHYHLVATNANGRADGADQSFTVPVYPGPPGTPPLRSSAYSGGVGSQVTFDPEPQWDAAVPMTIEAWVYRQDASRTEAIISHNWPGSYWLGFAPNLRFYRGTNYVELPYPTPAFKWTHVAVTYDGAIARFYINGNYVMGRALDNNGAGKLRTLRIGYDFKGTNGVGFFLNRFMGNLDELRLWSVARSEAEIQADMYREARGEPGLEAAFPRGGRIEEISGLVGVAGAGVSEQIFGMLPRDLVVPRAAIEPIANGQINLDSEYLGAEQLVLRFPDEPDTPDETAYFVHTDTNLFVAITIKHRNLGTWDPTNTWLGLFIDTTYDRPMLAQYPQVQLEAFQDFNTSHATWLNGDGAGGYYRCMFNNGITLPRPCTSPALWQVGELPCNGEINPDDCMELRISKSLLGSWDEYDGVALGLFNYGQYGESTFAPEEGYPESPDTWLTMSYGDASASLPRVLLSGHVYNSVSTSITPPLVGHRVSLFAGGAVYTNLTDALGRYSFDAPMPTNQVIYLQVDNVGFGRYRLPTVSSFGVQPYLIATNEVRFPAIPPNVPSVSLASVDFYVMPPVPASGITNADPISPVAGSSGRIGTPGGAGDIVTLYGTNLHSLLQFYLAPVTDYPDPSGWTLLPAKLLDIAPDGSWAKVQTPFVPEVVPLYAGGAYVVSFQSKWRWVAYDSWTRPNMVTYSTWGNFSLQRPPYPLSYGFNFVNQGASGSLHEFLACYGYNAYICVGALGYCATHVPDPIYWLIWYPVYDLWIGSSGGSCVGMSATSIELYNGVLNPSDFDPLAITAIGIQDPGFPGQWDTSNYGGFNTRPPIPLDVWARIRMNHGVQTTSEYLNAALDELESAHPGIRGDPVARLNAIRSNPTLNTIAMVPGLGSGHCVVPYRIEDNYGGDPNISRIWIYNNNAPCGVTSAGDSYCVTDQYIDIDHSADQYTFDTGAGVWSGSALFTTPLDIYTGEHTMPGLTDLAVDIPKLILLAAGSADADYTNSTGEWGWRADGTFVDNMPGLQAISPLGSPFNSTRTVPVFLPITNEMPTIELNVRGTNRYLFHAACVGTLLQLEMPEGHAGDRDQVQIGTLSNQLASFRFTPEHTLTDLVSRIGFEFTPQSSAVFRWQGLAAPAGQVEEFRALKDRRAVAYRNLSGGPARFSLRIDAVDGFSSNVTYATFGPFNVPTGAVQTVVLQDWPLVHQVRSELDLNADGTPDQVTMVSGVEVDSDGDGMPDDWEVLHQLDPQSAKCDDGAAGDPDHDGMSNYSEYLAGTDPRDSNSVLRLTATLVSGNSVRLSWPAVPGRRYELLSAGAMNQVFTTVPGGGFPRTATSTVETFDEPLTEATQTRYYRLRIVP